ncbi:acyl-CoA dehydrogenase [Sphaerotilus hippei]|uniref:Acyl-CoA dehydrogenase n=1 Tax=Sphaerotilus hippei TaxID=744406 RepID=A0A318H6Q4_9BURK|nr:acyl-CoA dehydrogenase family protein [Sphaerotilus hippei]PXW98128.1 acyl-CoA dehydrogenase [Sphaerotilus hippei]
MDTHSRPHDFQLILESARRIAADICAPHAADVDARARFPQESVEAFRRHGLLSAAVPASHGGPGCTMRQLGQLCAIIAGACGSSGMVLAMHYSQLACLVRHGIGAPFFDTYLRELVQQQYLLASITSEVGTFGDTRSSLCAVERDGQRFTLNKEATTGSYCAHADAILVTCRRDADAPASDQVLVLVTPGDYSLTQTTTWDTLGMRGTCSPGFRLESSASDVQILPGSFADSASQSMVPYSHILWSALWTGIATDALSKAAGCVRAAARKNPGEVPATARPLATAMQALQSMRHNWQAVADEFDAIEARGARSELLKMGWALKMNHLKVACSEQAPQLVHQALQIIGLPAFKNDSPLALGRHYRDALSAALMIANERIRGKSAALLMVLKDE